MTLKRGPWPEKWLRTPDLKYKQQTYKKMTVQK